MNRRMRLMLEIHNPFDKTNIVDLAPGNWPDPPEGVSVQYITHYSETGNAGGAYMADLDGDGIEEFFPVNDPRVFGRPRAIRVELAVGW